MNTNSNSNNYLRFREALKLKILTPLIISVVIKEGELDFDSQNEILKRTRDSFAVNSKV